MRVYSLFSGPSGPTAESGYYGVYSKTIWTVAAMTLKQALYLAGRDCWTKDGGPGIVEKYVGDGVWKRASGLLERGDPRLEVYKSRALRKGELEAAVKDS